MRLSFISRKKRTKSLKPQQPTTTLSNGSERTKRSSSNGESTASALSKKPSFQLPDTKQQQMSMLLGNERDWCSKSDETQIFRQRVRNSRRFESKKGTSDVPHLLEKRLMSKRGQLLSNNHQVLSKQMRFTSSHNIKVQNDSLSSGIPKLLRISVSLPKEDGSNNTPMCKAISVNTSQTASQIISHFIHHMLNETYQTNFDPDDFIFRYVHPETHEQSLLYGASQLKFFKCIYSEKITSLVLVQKYHALGYTEQDLKIKSISYSFDNTTNHSYSHDSLAFNSVDWYEMDYISLWDLGTPFRINIRGIDTIPITALFEGYLRENAVCVEDLGLYVCVELLHGAFKLAPKQYTKMIPYTNAPRFNDWLEFDVLMLCCIPRETKICFTLYARPYDKEYNVESMNNGQYSSKKEKDYPVAMVCSNLIDYKNTMRSGMNTARMWPDEAAGATQTCAENLSDDITLPPTVLSYNLPEYALPVIIPSGEPPARLMSDLQQYEKIQTLKFGKLARSTQDQEIERILQTDPLYKMTDSEKWHIWMNRDSLKSNPQALCKFLLSVPWDQPYAVHMAHQLLEEWEDLDPISALELLDYNYADSKVREYALSKLNKLSDEELAPFLLQLVQTLKYELTHDSALARFILQRGLRNTELIGHIMYWHLASEMHAPSIRERYGLILEEYLMNCGSHLRSLAKQKHVMDDLNRIANKIKEKDMKSLDAKIEYVRDAMSRVCWPEEFQLPLNPKIRACGIRPEKCKVMSSKKLPLWLVFKNADPEGKDIYVIFKAGDDLRQDLLTLQLLAVMDNMWKRENLDLHMKPYGCVCMGDEIGMIEVVLNSDTVANITHAQGGASAAFSDTPLEKWLQQQNPTPEEYSKCVENFMYSCAGYCVATYVLGIGDRHNDNIMLQKNGNLFHIDFGHFLGRRKKFAGIINRETSPFIFTKMYAKVLGKKNSDTFNSFQDYAAMAYNVLRKNASTIMMLFILMIGTGIPELQSIKDVEWIRKTLKLDKSDEEAADHFKKLVMKALANTRAQINDAAHIQKHKE